MARQAAPPAVAAGNEPAHAEKAPTRNPGHPGLPAAWWQAWILVLALVIVTGAVPVTLAGNALGLWDVHLPGTPQLAGQAARAPADLALPRQAWIATRTSVSPSPGGGTPAATLDPGFPVTLTEHAQAGGSSWSHIRWAGPTKATGGSGWVPDGAVVSYGAGGRAIGDLGALSPTLSAATRSDGSAFMVAIYFPDSGQLYRVNNDQSFALGDGFRAVLLTALYAQAESRHVAAPSTAAGSQSAQVAAGDGTGAAATYAQAGGASGISTYLRTLGLSGIQPAQTDWASAQASPSGMLAFYAALASGSVLNAADTVAVETQLTIGATLGASDVLGGSTAGTGGTLVVGSAQSSGGWTVSACGIVIPALGPRYVVAAVARNQTTRSQAQAVLSAFFAGLTPLLQ